MLATMEPQRYTLTERRFIVESAKGRHAYDLGPLANLTIDTHEDGTSDIGYRRPRDATALEPTVAYDDDAMSWSWRKHVLAHDVPDAETLMQRIASARRERSKAESPPDDESMPPAGATASASAIRQERLRAGVGRPSLLMAVAAILIGMVPIVLVLTGAAAAGSEFVALLAGGLFVGAGSVMLVRRNIGLRPASGPTPSAGVPRLLEPWVADLHPAFGLFMTLSGLGIILIDVSTGGPTVLSLLPAAVVIGGLILAFMSVRSRTRNRMLQREGVVTRGTIVGEIRGRRSGVAVYRYLLPDGREHTGRTRPLTFRDLERWGPGDEIDVRYDASNPSESTAFDGA